MASSREANHRSEERNTGLRATAALQDTSRALVASLSSVLTLDRFKY
jgi:hypothetical protein